MSKPEIGKKISQRTEYGVWIAGQVLTGWRNKTLMSAEQARHAAKNSGIKGQGIEKIPVSRVIISSEDYRENGDHVTVIFRKAWEPLD